MPERRYYVLADTRSTSDHESVGILPGDDVVDGTYPWFGNRGALVYLYDGSASISIFREERNYLIW